MASTIEPSIEARQAEFEQAVALSLHLWPSLSLAVESSWGGPDSEDKRAWFAGAIIDLFPPISALPTPTPQTTTATTTAQASDPDEPDSFEVESVLLQVMVDEFDVNVEDDSAYNVATQIITLREQCRQGDFALVQELRTRWTSKGGRAAAGGAMFTRANDAEQDTDWESDDSQDDDDVDMDEAPQLAQAAKPKQEPEVDEDGFTMVKKKK